MQDSIYRVSRTVSGLSAYVPGEQPQGGGWVKLNTNEFPYPPSPAVRDAVMRELGPDCASLRLYPAPLSDGLRAAVGGYYGVPAENVVCGNGSDDILNLVMRAFGDASLHVAAMNPSYSLYPVLSKMQGARLEEFDFEDGLSLPFEKIFESGANVFILTNPNAPLGVAFGEDELEKIARNFRGLFVIDEAYAPFSGRTSAGLAMRYRNVLSVGTSSKGWALAGMRVGWAVGDAAIIDVLNRVRDSYNVDRLAQAAGIAALGDRSYYSRQIARVVATRARVQEFFEKIGWNFVPSSSNFIFVRPVKRGMSPAEAAADFFAHLKSERILVRFWPDDPKIRDGLRVTVGAEEEMEKFMESAMRWKSKE